MTAGQGEPATTPPGKFQEATDTWTTSHETDLSDTIELEASSYLSPLSVHVDFNELAARVGNDEAVALVIKLRDALA